MSARRRFTAGFTVMEILIAGTVLAVPLLGMVSLFATGYTNVGDAGKLTMAVSAGQQMVEGMRSIPYENLPNLDGLDTANLATLPGADPEHELARRWRYALAGEGAGFVLSAEERAAWGTLATGSVPFGGRGRISVVNQTPTRRLVTVTVTIPGQGRTVQLATVITRL